MVSHIDDDEVIEIPDTSEEIAEHALGEDIEDPAGTSPKKENKLKAKLKKLWRRYLDKKKLTIPLTILVFLSLILTIPFSRYFTVGLFYKRSFSVTVFDKTTGRPVSEATVDVSGKTAKTNPEGVATISGLKVGTKQIKVTKSYYNDSVSKRLVPIKGAAKAEVQIEANGRQVPIAIVNKLSGVAAKGISVKTGDVEVKTNDDGRATIVLSPGSQTEKATISGEGYNQQEVLITVTDEDVPKNNFSITPAGKIYFLSKKSGKIDVVKTDLDGQNRETVLKATGNEEDNNTVLLASRDWQYLALQSRRDNDSKLYLIETANDKLTVIDQNETGVVAVGWSNHSFVYSVNRSGNIWEPNKSALKSFNAETKKLITLDESRAEVTGFESYAYESFGQVYILDNLLVYPKNWQSAYYSNGLLNGKRMSINSIRPDGSDRKVVRDFDLSLDNSSNIIARLYKPSEVYFQVTQQVGTVTYFEYEDGQVKATTTVSADTFNAAYPTFLVSPSGNRTFWSESRDGKNTLFLGDSDAGDAKEIASLSEYTPYGWFTQDYLLLSKSASELYALSPGHPEHVVKITDYHKPQRDFSGYGYGYGGF